ncbi:hypothetical protein [Clostridium sp. UBA6640]|uniref:hypothetical protein n=1 Tax=Clostridium sp. UBA6640 TaxID=1946370 RepID=UPI0025BCACCD|nr:hypothetical protein [Clostridium sp. UBA6640]
MKKRKFITKILILIIIFYMILYNLSVKFYIDEGKFALIHYKYEEIYDKSDYICVIRLNKPLAYIEKYKIERGNIVDIITKDEEKIVVSFLGEAEFYNIEDENAIELIDTYYLRPIELNFNMDSYKVKRKNFVFKVKSGKENIISFKYRKEIINIVLN